MQDIPHLKMWIFSSMKRHMGKFQRRSIVKHRQSESHFFVVVDILESVPPGGASLYKCSLFGDRSRIFYYLEDDLYAVSPATQDGIDSD
jgi:hypothetical protein